MRIKLVNVSKGSRGYLKAFTGVCFYWFDYSYNYHDGHHHCFIGEKIRPQGSLEN